jgi:lipid-binding SYLF domain-containing protein
MKHIGIFFGLLVLSAGMVFAQDNTSGSSSASSSTTTTTTTSSDRDAAQDSQEQSQRNSHKAAASKDSDMAAQDKSDAKNADTKGGEDHDKVLARLDDSAKILNELLGAPDNGIPDDVFKSSKCVAVVPSMVKGGFVFGAEHGRGVATCRTAKGWSAPAPFVITGGSWGAQIGAQAVDLVMLIMNDKGMSDLLSSKFKLGANGSVAAGPIGRDASASTDWKMKAEVLTYSRTRGLFAGLTLDGAVIKQDDDSTRALYGHETPFRQILMGRVPAPAGADTFLATVRRSKSEANAAAH